MLSKPHQLLSCAADVGIACAAPAPPVVPEAKPKGLPTARTFLAANSINAKDLILSMVIGVVLERRRVVVPKL